MLKKTISGARLVASPVFIGMAGALDYSAFISAVRYPLMMKCVRHRLRSSRILVKIHHLPLAAGGVRAVSPRDFASFAICCPLMERAARPAAS